MAAQVFFEHLFCLLGPALVQQYHSNNILNSLQTMCTCLLTSNMFVYKHRMLEHGVRGAEPRCAPLPFTVELRPQTTDDDADYTGFMVPTEQVYTLATYIR